MSNPTEVFGFGIVYPELAEKYWDYEKNCEIPNEVSFTNTSVKYWFRCEKGHSFQKTVPSLIRGSRGREGVCPVCSGRRVIAGVNDVVTLFPDRMKEWRYDLNDVNPNTLPSNSTHKMIAVCGTEGCNNTYEVEVQYWVRGCVNDCEKHRKVLNGLSEAACNVAEMIASWGIEVAEDVPLGDTKYSLDMYLPKLNIAIEYNGLIWHAESNRGKDLHYNKYKLCKDLGIRLIYIWEDDWLHNRELVKTLLAVKLGVSDLPKVNARDCNVCYISTNDAREFMDANHIQGFVSGEAYIALRNKGIVVAVIIIDGIEDSIYIKRYATVCNVRGGFSKLLSHIEKTYNFSKFYTFSDNSISDGDLYKNAGFFVDDYIKPDYSYIVGGKRVHKSNYRKDRFRSDKKLVYKEGLTEKELADLNGLERIWDAGKIKWVKNV